MKHTRRPTQNDVAKKAGVSVATISRHINQTGYISPGVRERINSAIKVLRYKPNLVARTLKMRSSNTIGLIFPDIENPFFISLIKKTEEVAQRHRYNVILCNTENRPEKELEYLDMLKAKLVDGYIIIPSITTGSLLREMLRGEKVVFLDRTIGGKADEIIVKLDNQKAVKIAIDYLARLGHTRVGAVHVPINVTTGLERMEGYRAALRSNGLTYDEDLVRYADFSVESARRKTKELLTARLRPTALLPMSGPTTIGALKAIRELRLRIPFDISVIGFDEFDYAELLNPPLTTVAQPAYEFGADGIELLLRLMKDEKIGTRTVVKNPFLIERGSCRDIRGASPCRRAGPGLTAEEKKRLTANSAHDSM